MTTISTQTMTFFKCIFSAAFLLIMGVQANAQIIGDLDTTFNAPDTGFGEYCGASGQVNSIVKQPDGKILIAGDFMTYDNVSRNRIARLNADGTLDTSFDPGTGFAGTLPPSVRCIALQADGKVIVAGKFLTFNGVERNRIARLNADGTLDTTFDPGTGTSTTASHYIESVVVQEDGKIIIAGFFNEYNGTAVNKIARLNTDGTLDTTFAGEGVTSAAGHAIYHVSLQPDGKIIIGGQFTAYAGQPVSRIARLNADGTLDTSFNTGTGSSGAVRWVAVQPDGKIIVAGEFTSFNEISAGRLVRLNADGTVDESFNTDGTGGNTGKIGAVRLLPDGKILIGGTFIQYNDVPRNKIARLTEDGALDTLFEVGAGITTELKAFELQDDNRIIIGGSFSSYDYVTRKNIARLDANGGMDYSFNPETGINGSVYTTAVQPDNKVIAAGFFTHVNETGIRNLVRLNENGSVDTTFHPGTSSKGSGIIEKILVQPDGKILIGGYFKYYNEVSRNAIARVNPDGSLDTTFSPGTGAEGVSPRVTAIAIQEDGKIIVGGIFSSFNGDSTKAGLVRLNEDGSIDPDFNAEGNGISPHAYVYSIALQPDGKIIITGDFISYNGVSAGSLARLNADGSLDMDFNENAGTGITIFGMGSQLYSTLVTPDNKILIAGLFDKYNGETSRNIALLNTDGTLDTAFSSGTGTSWNAIYTITMQPDGKILAGGDFNIYNGNAVNRICRINTDGSFDTTFDPGIGASSKVSSISLQYEKGIIISGDFTSFNGIGRNRIARLYGDHCLTRREIDHHVICAGESLEWLDGITYSENNETAVYIDEGASPAGCDIERVLNLTVLDSIHTAVTVADNELIAEEQPGASYQWVDCDNGQLPVPGATERSFRPEVSGRYAVQITVAGCTQLSACHTIDLLSVDDMNTDQLLSLYPNPVDDILSVTSSRSADVIISDILGREVKALQLTAYETADIDVSDLQSGIYFIRIRDQGAAAGLVRKFIKN